MLPKIDELVATCSASHPDIVCLVEAWLVDILNSEVFIPNYSVVRVDRNRYGGGVLVYVHSSITYNVLFWSSLLCHYLETILSCVKCFL